VIPRYDAWERHEVIVNARPSAVYQRLRTTDFRKSRLTMALLTMRALPQLLGRGTAVRPNGDYPITLDSFIDAGATIIGERAGYEIVFGITGPFWEPCPKITPAQVEEFRAGPPPGTAYAAWGFMVRAVDVGRTRLTTETRVLTGDPGSLRRFRRYWMLARPFSGLIRRQMLRAIRRAAEADMRKEQVH
jgi:hypothetical protein